jgi:hypothetical protein
MATLFDCRDLGKELGQAKMETQLQRQVLTIFLIIKIILKMTPSGPFVRRPVMTSVLFFFLIFSS